MSRELQARPTMIARVVRAASPRHRSGAGRNRSFEIFDSVRSLTQVKNDGIYPHRDIGEVLVHPGDAGRVRDSWSFLGETYYTVEFQERAAVVIMRGKELEQSTQR